MNCLEELYISGIINATFNIPKEKIHMLIQTIAVMKLLKSLDFTKN